MMINRPDYTELLAFSQWTITIKISNIVTFAFIFIGYFIFYKSIFYFPIISSTVSVLIVDDFDEDDVILILLMMMMMMLMRLKMLMTLVRMELMMMTF